MNNSQCKNIKMNNTLQSRIVKNQRVNRSCSFCFFFFARFPSVAAKSESNFATFNLIVHLGRNQLVRSFRRQIINVVLKSGRIEAVFL